MNSGIAGLLAPQPHVLHATIGITEMIIILVVVLIVFGANRLPQLGDSLGKSIKNFKKAVTQADEIEVTPKKEIPQTAESKTTAESKH